MASPSRPSVLETCSFPCVLSRCCTARIPVQLLASPTTLLFYMWTYDGWERTPSRRNHDDFVRRNAQWQKSIEQRLEEERKKYAQKEVEDCTFHPQLEDISRSSSRSSSPAPPSASSPRLHPVFPPLPCFSAANPDGCSNTHTHVCVCVYVCMFFYVFTRTHGILPCCSMFVMSQVS